MIEWTVIAVMSLVFVAVGIAHRDGYQVGREHGYQEGVKVGRSQQQISQDRRIHPHP